MRRVPALIFFALCFAAVLPITCAQSPKQFSEQLLAAVNAGQAAQVRALLRRGANPNARRYDGPYGSGSRSSTALMEAATLGNYPIVRALLASGANVNARGYSLHLGAPRGEGDYHRSTALIEACLRGDNEEVAAALLAHGAEVNAADKSGGTALSNSMWLSDWPQAEMLLAHGAHADRKMRRLIARHLAQSG